MGSVGKTVGAFFLLLIVLSVPFWLLGFWEGKLLPAQLPISALQAVCPLLAAVILTGWHEGRGGIRDLFKRVMEFRASGYLGLALQRQRTSGAGGGSFSHHDQCHLCAFSRGGVPL